MVSSLTPNSAERVRLRGLDGLRAIAVTTVILFHVTPGLLLGGYIGVDVFFVISGFLITTLLLRERAETGRIVLHKFWVRRARRLLPALALVVLASCTAALVIGGDVLVRITTQVLGAATFSYNWLGIANATNYFDDTTPELFRNLWSLAVEEQFYVVWPFVVVALLLVPWRWVRLSAVTLIALGSIAAMLALLMFGASPTRLYYGTDTHSFGLAIGAALALIVVNAPARLLEWRRGVRTLLASLGVAATAGLLVTSVLLTDDSELVFRGGLVLVAVLTALAIAGSIVPGSYLGRALDVAPMRVIGERSYGLYLWHWPVFVLVAAAAPDLNPWVIAAITLGITAAAAALSYRFVEMPIRKRGFRAVARSAAGAWRSGALRFAGATFTAFAVGALIAASGVAIATAPSAGLTQERIEAGQAAIDRQPPPPRPNETGEPATLPGGDQIYAIGDSVMLAAADEVLATFPGIVVDAAVSRRMRDAPALVQALIDADQLRPILILGLGTNGPVDQSSLDEVKALVGSDTEIVLINAQAPRDWIPGVNELLARYAQEHRNVELANWYAAIQPRLDVLSRDKIHAGGAIGGTIYAEAIRSAIQRLAELPPLLRNSDYGLSPRPA